MIGYNDIPQIQDDRSQIPMNDKIQSKNVVYFIADFSYFKWSMLVKLPMTFDMATFWRFCGCRLIQIFVSAPTNMKEDPKEAASA